MKLFQYHCSIAECNRFFNTFTVLLKYALFHIIPLQYSLKVRAIRCFWKQLDQHFAVPQPSSHIISQNTHSNTVQNWKLQMSFAGTITNPNVKANRDHSPPIKLRNILGHQQKKEPKLKNRAVWEFVGKLSVERHHCLHLCNYMKLAQNFSLCWFC